MCNAQPFDYHARLSDYIHPNESCCQTLPIPPAVPTVSTTIAGFRCPTAPSAWHPVDV